MNTRGGLTVEVSGFQCTSVREKWKSWVGAAANKAKSPQQSPIHRRDVVNRLTRPVSLHPCRKCIFQPWKMFKQESVTELKGRVQRAKKVVITACRSPDGDAIGSSLALQHLLVLGRVVSGHHARWLP